MKINTAIDNKKEVVVSLSGRLDANSTRELRDVLSKSIDNGYTKVLIDCENLNEVSSAGLDFLLLTYNKFNEFNGSFSLKNTSYELEKFFNKINAASIIRGKNSQNENAISKPNKYIKADNTIYKFYKLSNSVKSPCLEAFGNPDKFEYKEFSYDDAFLLQYSKNTIGLGLGTLSYDMYDEFTSFGEYINLGNYTFYIPPNEKCRPDYQKINSSFSENQTCKINSLYGLRANNDFSNFVNFYTEDEDKALNIVDLISALMQSSNSQAISFVICAQINAISGLKLINPIFSRNNSNIFEKSSFEKNFKFIGQNDYANHTVMLVGFAINQANSIIRKFLKPFDKIQSIYAHIHALVFNSNPLNFSYENSINDIVSQLVKDSQAIDLCHLINDEINKTSFTNGICFFNSLKEFRTGEF